MKAEEVRDWIAFKVGEYHIMTKPLTRRQQIADILLSTFDEFTYGEMNEQDYENLNDLIKMRYSLEPPSQQAKQTGVGEQHDDGRVGAGKCDTPGSESCQLNVS